MVELKCAFACVDVSSSWLTVRGVLLFNFHEDMLLLFVGLHLGRSSCGRLHPGSCTRVEELAYIGFGCVPPVSS